MGAWVAVAVAGVLGLVPFIPSGGSGKVQAGIVSVPATAQSASMALLKNINIFNERIAIDHIQTHYGYVGYGLREILGKNRVGLSVDSVNFFERNLCGGFGIVSFVIEPFKKRRGFPPILHIDIHGKFLLSSRECGTIYANKRIGALYTFRAFHGLRSEFFGLFESAFRIDHSVSGRSPEKEGYDGENNGSNSHWINKELSRGNMQGADNRPASLTIFAIGAFFLGLCIWLRANYYSRGWWGALGAGCAVLGILAMIFATTIIP